MVVAGTEIVMFRPGLVRPYDRRPLGDGTAGPYPDGEYRVRGASPIVRSHELHGMRPFKAIQGRHAGILHRSGHDAGFSRSHDRIGSQLLIFRPQRYGSIPYAGSIQRLQEGGIVGTEHHLHRIQRRSFGRREHRLQVLVPLAERIVVHRTVYVVAVRNVVTVERNDGRIRIGDIVVRNGLLPESIQLRNVHLDLLVIHPVLHGHLELYVALVGIEHAYRHLAPLPRLAARYLFRPVHGDILRRFVGRRLVILSGEHHLDGIRCLHSLEIARFARIGGGTVENEPVVADRQGDRQFLLAGGLRFGIAHEELLQVLRQRHRGLDVGERTDKVVHLRLRPFYHVLGHGTEINGTLPIRTRRPRHIVRMVRRFGRHDIRSRRKGQLLVPGELEVGIGVNRLLAALDAPYLHLVVTRRIGRRTRRTGRLRPAGSRTGSYLLRIIGDINLQG